MAAILYSRLRPTRLLLIHRYCSTAVTPKTSSQDQLDKTDAGELRIPMVPKNRDPNAVLNALASTVEPTEYSMIDGMGPKDPLYPLEKASRLRYIRHIEAGRKAADQVLRRWPETFKLKKLDSEPLEQPKYDLDYFLSRNKGGKAVREYMKLKAKGEAVPLESKNKVLALAAYFGLENPFVPRNLQREIYIKHKDISWWPVTGKGESPGTSQGTEAGAPLSKEASLSEEAALSEEASLSEQASLSKEAALSEEASFSEEASLSEEAASEEESVSKEDVSDRATQMDDIAKKFSKKKIENSIRIWSLDNVAEKMFKEDFEKKDAVTYEAMIQGLVRYKYFSRAFQLFDEMRSLGLQAQTSTYNLLLSAMCDADICNKSSWETARVLVKHMTYGTQVDPNKETFNLLLQISEHHPNSCDIALEIMREMFHVGVEPSLGTFYLVLKIFKDQGKSHLVVEEMIDYLKTNPGVIQLQSAECPWFFGEAMYACGYIPRTKPGIELYHLYRDHGNNGLLMTQNRFMGRYLFLITRECSVEVAMEEYKKIVPSLLSPTEWVVNILLKKLLWSKTQQHSSFLKVLWSDVRQSNVRIQEQLTVKLMAKFIAHCDIPSEDLQEYFDILDDAITSLEDQRNFPCELTITIAIDIALRLGDYDSAWKYFNALDHYGYPLPLPTVHQLLTAYASPESKDRMLRIFRMLQDVGGCISPEFIRTMCRKADIKEDYCLDIISKVGKKKKTTDFQTDEFLNDPQFLNEPIDGFLTTAGRSSDDDESVTHKNDGPKSSKNEQEKGVDVDLLAALMEQATSSNEEVSDEVHAKDLSVEAVKELEPDDMEVDDSCKD